MKISVITPKIFAGTKNSNGTLTGVAMGKFSLSVLNFIRSCDYRNNQWYLWIQRRI